MVEPPDGWFIGVVSFLKPGALHDYSIASRNTSLERQIRQAVFDKLFKYMLNLMHRIGE